MPIIYQFNEALAQRLERYHLRHDLRRDIEVALASVNSNADHLQQKWEDEPSDHIGYWNELERILRLRKAEANQIGEQSVSWAKST